MRLLALLNPTATATPEEIRRHAAAENRVIWDLYKRQVIRDMYFRTDRPGAVLMLECASLEEGQAAMRTLPLVAEGMLGVELIPIGPFVPLENLFAPAG